MSVAFVPATPRGGADPAPGTGGGGREVVDDRGGIVGLEGVAFVEASGLATMTGSGTIAGGAAMMTPSASASAALALALASARARTASSITARAPSGNADVRVECMSVAAGLGASDPVPWEEDGFASPG